jgi:hypothetical protein
LREFLFEGRDMLVGDVLRVLGFCMGRLWFSELVAEVNAFRSTLGDACVDDDSVRDALRVLESSGVIVCEERLRSQLIGDSVPDILISIVDYGSLMDLLKLDRRYNEYIYRYRSSIT